MALMILRLCFLLKVKKPLDSVNVVRHPSETRPLKFKNHDNKIIAGERNFALSSVIKTFACELQNGFISGRIFYAMLLVLMLLQGLLLFLIIGLFYI